MISTLSIISMGISAAISIGLPLCLFFILRKKYNLKVVPLLVGAAAFMVFALGLEQIAHMLILRPMDSEVGLISSNPLLYVIYAVFAAGIFEETARFLSFMLLKKKYKGLETALSYGIGHGGIEAVILVGVSMITYIVLSIAVNSGNASALGAAVQSQITDLVNADPLMFLLSGLERILAISIHICLSLIVWIAAGRKDRRWLYPAAIFLHAAVDVPAALFQVGAIPSVLLTEALVVVCTVLLALITVFTCRKTKI